MRSKWWRRFLVPGLLLGGSPPCAAAPDPQALTAEMAARIAKAAPQVKVKVAGPLTLKLSGGPEGETELNLDRIAAFCAENPAEDCERAKVRFIAGAVEMATIDYKITRERLRVIVRPADYASTAEATLGQQGKSIVTRPVGDGLVAMLAADFPTTVSILNTRDLAALHLGADEAFELGRKNVLEHLPKLPKAADLRREAVMFADRDYEASLLLADGWPQLARATSGKLFVTVAADNRIVIGVVEDGEQVRRLREAVVEDFRAAERGISTEVYRWSEKGWIVAK